MLVLLKCLLLFAFSRCSIVVVYYLIICKIFNGNFSGILTDFFWCRHMLVHHLPGCNF